jgi:hypothetical protein
MLAPYKYLKFFPSSIPMSYNPYHHDPLTCKNCSMKFWVLFYIYASLDNDMDHAHVFYKSCTMVLLLEMGLEPLLPYTARKLDIHSYGVPLSCIAYTKHLLFSLYPYSSSVGMLGSSNPPSATLLLDLSVDIGSLSVVRLPAEPLPEFGIFVVLMGILDVVRVSSQINDYVACP